MNHINYRTLIDQGRKSGLNTTELYRALATHAADPSDFARGPADSNGFVSTLDERGHSIYKPQDGVER